MAVTLQEIEKLAELSRLSLSTEEKEKMRGEIDAILAYVGELRSFPEDADVTPQQRISVNVMREDANPHESGRYTETLLSVAPKREGNYIKVKKIL